MTKQAIDVHDAVSSAGLELPPVAAALASYVPVRRSGHQVFVSGQVPIDGGVPLATGRVPEDVSVERAAQLAERCALQGIAALASVLEPGEGLARVVRVGGFVAASGDFTQHPAVINGCSDLLERVFGEVGRHARAAVGVASLPLGVPVEIEFLFEVGELG